MFKKLRNKARLDSKTVKSTLDSSNRHKKLEVYCNIAVISIAFGKQFYLTMINQIAMK